MDITGCLVNQPYESVPNVSALTLIRRGGKMAKPLVIYPTEKEFDVHEYIRLKLQMAIIDELFGE